MATYISIPTFSFGASKKLQMGGLVSGLDVSELINAQTSASQSKLITEYQKKQQLVWQQEQYREITSKLRSFQDNFLKFSSGSANNMKSTSLFSSFKATASSDAVTVTAKSGTSTEGFTIKSVDSIATGASISSDDSILNGSITSSTKLTDLTANLGVKAVTTSSVSSGSSVVGNISESTRLSDLSSFSSSATEIEVGGVTVEITEDMTISELVSAINKDSDSTVSASFSEDDGFTLKAKTAGSSGSVDYDSNGTGIFEDLFGNDKIEVTGEDAVTTTVKIGEVDIEIDANMTIAQLVSKINNNSDSKVKASFSSFDGGFKLTSKTTGTTSNVSDIKYDDNNTGLLDALWGTRVEKDGTDAQITLLKSDGTTAVRTSETNDFDIDGVNIVANKVTNEEITVKVNKDVDKAMDVIKKFVEEFNDILSSISSAVNQKKLRDVLPLTDDQRNEMSDKELETWDKKAMQGLLSNDPALNAIMTQLSSISNYKNDTTGLTLGNIGIKQEGWTTSFIGKLIIDEDKLRDALENNSGDVANIFAEKGGVVDQLNVILDSAISTSPSKMGSLIRIAGDPDSTDTSSNIYREMKERDSNISMLREKLDDQYDRELARYTALETMLNKLNASSSMFSQ